MCVCVWPHAHVEHTQWGHVKVTTRGMCVSVCVCECVCVCVWPHAHVEHTQWGHVKVTTRGMCVSVCVCECVCVCVCGPTPMLNTLSGATSKLLQEVRVCLCLHENRF